MKLILALIPVEILKEEKGVENEILLKEREPERYMTATRGAVAAVKGRDKSNLLIRNILQLYHPLLV